MPSVEKLRNGLVPLTFKAQQQLATIVVPWHALLRSKATQKLNTPQTHMQDLAVNQFDVFLLWCWHKNLRGLQIPFHCVDYA